MLMEFKGSIKRLKKESDFITSLTDVIKQSFPRELPTLRINIELVNMICNNIEDYHKYKLKGQKIDKEDLFFKVFESVFGSQANASERAQLIALIKFLHENKKINSRTFLRYCFDIFRSLFNSK